MLVALLCLGLLSSIAIGKRIWQIEQFNGVVLSGGVPADTAYRFEAKYAAAYAQARNGRYQDANQLFNQLMEMEGTPAQIAAVQYNLGNIYMIRGLMVNRNGDTVKDEAEYLLNQARLAYEQSLRLDNNHLDARHNLDRVLSMLPDDPDVGDNQEKLGIVMGSIPTGLP
ncbi:mxaK protein [Methylophilaceae bacterium]|nr:mxaK protein [Methylophilaceae bacterium]